MICNGPKWIISISGGLGLLQIILEPGTEWCASEDAGPPREVDCDPTLVGEGNNAHSLL